MSIGLDDLNAMGITFDDWKRIKKTPSGTVFNPFCELIFGTDYGLQRCGEEEQKATIRISSSLKLDISTCHAGLTHLYLPIIARGQYCGYMGVRGGLLLHKPKETEWQQITELVKDTGIDLKTLKTVYFNMTPQSQEQIDEMVKIMNIIMADIVRIAIEIHDSHV
jgi:ligand-binding sensor protein